MCPLQGATSSAPRRKHSRRKTTLPSACGIHPPLHREGKRDVPIVGGDVLGAPPQAQQEKDNPPVCLRHPPSLAQGGQAGCAHCRGRRPRRPAASTAGERQPSRLPAASTLPCTGRARQSPSIRFSFSSLTQGGLAGCAHCRGRRPRRPAANTAMEKLPFRQPYG